MNLFEAKKIAERAGYRVIKEGKKDSKMIPPWAKKQAMLREAKEIAERAGYRVIKEGVPSKRMGIQGNGMNGSVLASLAEEWITGSPCKFEVINNSMDLEAAKAEFLSAVETLVGHGVTSGWYNQIESELGRRSNLAGCLLYLNELMQGGQGRSRWGNGRRWC